MKKTLLTIILVSVFSSAFALGDRSMAKLVAEDLNMDEDQVFQVLKTFKQQVSMQLKQGKTIRLQGFGQFYLEHTGERVGNPNTGEMGTIPAKNYLRFKPSKEGNKSVN